jgi:ketosteroid isomerase-like protein
VAAAEPVAGSVADEVQAAHEALRALKQDAEQAFNRMGASGKREDFDVLLDYVTDDVVLAAMNGQFAVGKKGLIAYFERMMTGPDRSVQSIHHKFDVADLTVLYGGDTGVAYGTSVGTYELSDGLSFVVDTNWTATMVKQDGRWRLASFQFGPNIFDNPVLNRAVNALRWGVGLALVIGLLIGFLVGRRFAGRRTAT